MTASRHLLVGWRLKCFALLQESANAIRQRAARKASNAQFLEDKEEPDKAHDADDTGAAERQYAQELSKELRVDLLGSGIFINLLSGERVTLILSLADEVAKFALTLSSHKELYYRQSERLRSL